MKIKIFLSFFLLLGSSGCITITTTHHGTGTYQGHPAPQTASVAAPRKAAANAPQTVGATVMECIYQQGCYPVRP